MTKHGTGIVAGLSLVLMSALPLVANAQFNLFGGNTNTSNTTNASLISLNLGGGGGGGGAGGSSTAADAMCIRVDNRCPCGQVMNSKGQCQQASMSANPYMCPNYCKGPTPNGGYVVGHCVSNNVCHGDTYTGQNGKNAGTDAGFGQLSQMLGQLMGKLMQGGGQGGGGGSPAPTTPTTPTSAGCTSYYQSSVPSSDPCAYYVPNPTSLTGSGSNLNVSGDLLNALGNGSGTGSDLTGLGNISDTLTQSMNQSLTGLGSTTDTNTNTNVNNNSGSGSASSSTSTVQLLPGLGQGGGAQGNIQVLPNGATIVANTVDTQGNTAVAGFYGSDTTLGGQQPQGVVAKLCQSRPWSGNVLTYIIPSSFFDGLCQWQGYQVGSTQKPSTQSAPQNVTLTQTPLPAKSASSSATNSGVTPKVQIWAVPASVPLGARTSIEWTTQGVTSCTETSPDGSFTANTLQGTAATVPLTGPTTYSISCQGPDGSPVTGYVTVNIAL